jgi:hypothetical protein
MAGDKLSSRAAAERLPEATTREKIDISAKESAIFANNAKVFYEFRIF